MGKEFSAHTEQPINPSELSYADQLKLGPAHMRDKLQAESDEHEAASEQAKAERRASLEEAREAKTATIKRFYEIQDASSERVAKTTMEKHLESGRYDRALVSRATSEPTDVSSMSYADKLRFGSAKLRTGEQDAFDRATESPTERWEREKTDSRVEAEQAKAEAKQRNADFQVELQEMRDNREAETPKTEEGPSYTEMLKQRNSELFGAGQLKKETIDDVDRAMEATDKAFADLAEALDSAASSDEHSDEEGEVENTPTVVAKRFSWDSLRGAYKKLKEEGFSRRAQRTAAGLVAGAMAIGAFAGLSTKSESSPQEVAPEAATAPADILDQAIAQTAEVDPNAEVDVLVADGDGITQIIKDIANSQGLDLEPTQYMDLFEQHKAEFSELDWVKPMKVEGGLGIDSPGMKKMPRSLFQELIDNIMGLAS